MKKEIYKLPALTPDTMEELMAERISAVKTPKTPIPMLWQGLSEMNVMVSGSQRTAKVYVPQDCPQGTMFVLLNVPEGEETVSFLEKSGWIEQADQKQLCLFAAEPASGGWQDAEQEQPYLEACFQALKDGVYFRGGLTVYITGYGRIGTCLHKIAAANPLKTAAAVFIDAGELEPAWLSQLEETSLNTADRCYGDFCYKDIPVPVWIVSKTITEKTAAAAEHWKRCCKAGEAVKDDIFGQIYSQTEDSCCTPDGPAAQTAVKEAACDPCSPELTASICSFLKRFSRFGSQGPIGNTLSRAVDYDALGVEFRHFTDAFGTDREYLVYMPKACRGGGKFPLVFAVHGACESIRNYFEESHWYRKAEEKGFIVAMPETILTPVPEFPFGGPCKAWRCLWQIRKPELKQHDITYINQVLDQLIAEYPVDEKRIYCTGHSMGCMTTQVLGSGKTGRRFAALGVTSGVFSNWDETGTERMPIFMTMGQYDLWQYLPGEDSDLSADIEFWLVRDGLANKNSAREVRIAGASKSHESGRWVDYVWKNTDGIPLIRYSWIRAKDHMNTPAENSRLWDEWFSKWSLDEENRRCYEGKPI